MGDQMEQSRDQNACGWHASGPSANCSSNLFQLELDKDSNWQVAQSAVISGHVTGIHFNDDETHWAVSAMNDSVAFFRNAENIVPDRNIEVKHCFNGTWIPKSSLYVAVGNYGDCFVHDFATQKDVNQFTAHTGRFSAISASPDGNLLATGGNDGEVKLWNTSDFRLVSSAQRHRGEVASLAWNPNAQEFASAGEDGLILIDQASPKPTVCSIKNSESYAPFCWATTNQIRTIRNNNELIDYDPRHGNAERSQDIGIIKTAFVLNENMICKNVDSRWYVTRIDKTESENEISSPIAQMVCPLVDNVGVVAASSVGAIPKVFMTRVNRSCWVRLFRL